MNITATLDLMYDDPQEQDTLLVDMLRAGLTVKLDGGVATLTAPRAALEEWATANNLTLDVDSFGRGQLWAS